MKLKIVLFILIEGLFSLSVSTGYAQDKENLKLFHTDSFDSSCLNLDKLSLKNYSALIDISNKDERKSYFPQQNIKHERLLLSSLVLISLNYAAYQPFKNVWWEEERTHFHFYRGWRRNRGYWDFGWHDTLYGHIDKLGHYYSARLLSEHIYKISRWIGFKENSSKLIGPILSSLLMLEIEIYDGFFKEWGFSLADFAANEIGAFSPLIKEKIPFLDNFQLKLSYHPSNIPDQETTFIKDYSGMTFWLSYNLCTLMPEPLKKHYPSWLNLALGYSISKPTRGRTELYLSPDINWMKIPWGNSQTMIFIKKTLNNFHVPCFTLKLHPDKKFYTVYF